MNFPDKISKIRTNIGETSDSPDTHTENTLLWHTLEPVTMEQLNDIINEAGIKCSPFVILPLTVLEDNLYFNLSYCKL